MPALREHCPITISILQGIWASFSHSTVIKTAWGLSRTSFIIPAPPNAPMRLLQQPADTPLSAASVSFSIKVELYRCQQ